MATRCIADSPLCGGRASLPPSLPPFPSLPFPSPPPPPSPPLPSPACLSAPLSLYETPPPRSQPGEDYCVCASTSYCASLSVLSLSQLPLHPRPLHQSIRRSWPTLITLSVSLSSLSTYSRVQYVSPAPQRRVTRRRQTPRHPNSRNQNHPRASTASTHFPRLSVLSVVQYSETLRVYTVPVPSTVTISRSQSEQSCGNHWVRTSGAPAKALKPEGCVKAGVRCGRRPEPRGWRRSSEELAWRLRRPVYH